MMREGKLKAVEKEGGKAGNIHIVLVYWQVLLYGLSSRGESIAVHVNGKYCPLLAWSFWNPLFTFYLYVSGLSVKFFLVSTSFKSEQQIDH